MGRSKLGGRFKAALEQPAGVAGSGQAMKAEVSPEVAAARQANEELIADLMELGADLEGLVNVSQKPRRVTFERLGHKLVFQFAADKARARVSWPGGHEKDHTFFKNDVWHMTFYEPRTQSVALFDDGLEYLMVKGLGLPRPGSNKVVKPLSSGSGGGKSARSDDVPGSAVQELDELW